MEFLRIVALAVAAAVLYGIVEVLVTAHVFPEHFTVLHSRIIDFDAPVVLALFWGVFGTWWIGLPLGVLLGLAARSGTHTAWSAGQLVRPLTVLLGVLFAASLVSGVTGFALAATGTVAPPREFLERLPGARFPASLAVQFAHTASYAVGAIGGIVAAVRVARTRRREAAELERKQR